MQACENLDIAFVPYFPLKSGLLTGTYRRDGLAPEGSRLNAPEESHFSSKGNQLLTEDNLDVVEELIAFAEAAAMRSWNWPFRGCWRTGPSRP